jgi:VWFA-related protein
MVASFLLRNVVGLAAVVFVGTVSAQIDPASQSPPVPSSQQPDTSSPVFRQSVRRVVVDIVVSGSNGKPVSGLTAVNFSISEDGKPQRIRSFDVHDFDLISDSLPKLPPSLPANTFINVPAGPERGPLYVLLLDLVDMGVDDQPRAREQLLKFIQSKPQGTRFAIFVFSDGLHLVQGFTEDQKLLAAAVDPKNPHSHIPRIFLYADNYQPYASTPRVLINIAKFLAELPGHKNVIWLSASFPSSIMPGSDASVEGLTINDEIKEATDTLARGQIAVYPVDVRGLVATHVTTSPSGAAMATTTDSAALNASHMTEQEIADATGGQAFYSTNDVATALAEATETGAHYYTLTYSPSNQNYNGRLRHINVELSKRGYHLSYRRSYYGNPSQSETREKHSASELEPLTVSLPADSLYPNIQHGAPLAHQLLFRAHVHALAPPAKATSEQMANLEDQTASRERRKDPPSKPRRPINLQRYEIDYAVAARYPALEVAAVAFDEDGKILNVSIQRTAEARAGIPAGERHDDIYHIQQQFDVPVAATSIRLAVRDVATDNVGALEINLPLAPEEQTDDAFMLPAGSPALTLPTSRTRAR